MRGRLRGLRDSNGQPIFVPMVQDASRYALVTIALVITTPSSTSWYRK